jgi:tetratricopeptide (TPR) repeat protein
MHKKSRHTSFFLAILLTCLHLLLFPSLSYCQTEPVQPSADEQLAVQYYQSGEFAKALIYYEKLFGKKQSELYYNYYVDCLIQTKDYKRAEKVIRKQIKSFPYDLSYRVDLGSLFNSAGEESKAKKEFEQAIKDISPNQNQVFGLAKAFLHLKEYDYAIDTYKKGRKLIPFYPFNFELAEVYDNKKDYVAMANEYLDAVAADERTLQSVQNVLQDKFNRNVDPKKNDILKGELLRRVQKENNGSIFSELLLWMLIQQKEFDAAFVQARALDKRKKQEGTRVMDLASICTSNEDFETAVKCYQYVISLGSDSYFYQNARLDLLTALNRRITGKGNWAQAEILDLEKMYKTVLHDLGSNNVTAKAMQELAHLEAFYLDNTKEASELLDAIVEMPQVSPLAQAESKLELGDILLLNGDIWEASLKYSQVEKAYKHDPIGQEAKFRNAKVGFYTGDFKWAQAQLDVLKGATSKLIANDAMALSLLISENQAEDSSNVAMRMFARADLLSFRNKNDQAMTVLDSINKLFPNDPLSDDILMKRANIVLKQGRYEDAIVYYQKVVTNYGADILADEALYDMAVIYDEKLKNKEKAMALYQDLMLKYPGSTFVVEGRKRYRALRGDTVN